MSLGWILLAVVGWRLGLLFVLVLMCTASDQDREARHAQKRLDPSPRDHHLELSRRLGIERCARAREG